MNRKQKAIINLILIGIGLFCLIVINLFMYFKNMNVLYEDKTRTINKIKISYPYFKDDKDTKIDEYLKKVDASKVDRVKYLVNYLGGYTNVIFRLYHQDKIVDYHSILFNKNGQEIVLSDIITNEEAFWHKVDLYLLANPHKLKPEELAKATKSYLFKDFEVEIYLTNYNESGNIALININYNEIKDYLKIPYKLSKNYKFLEEIPVEIPEIPPEIPEPIENKKLVAFTFDDGPSDYTLELLEVLDEFKAKSTFFVVGYNIKMRNSVILETVNRGHEIGNHTVDHSRLTKLKGEQVKAKLDANNELLYNITDNGMGLLRPPYGAVNDKIKPFIEVPIIMWSVDSRDWESRNTEKIVAEVLSSIQAGDIVLFHDLYAPTIEAIKVLLPILYADDYQLVTVSELFARNNRILESGIVYRNAR